MIYFHMNYNYIKSPAVQEQERNVRNWKISDPYV